MKARSISPSAASAIANWRRRKRRRGNVKHSDELSPTATSTGVSSNVEVVAPSPWQLAPRDILEYILDIATADDNVERSEVLSPFCHNALFDITAFQEDDEAIQRRANYRSVCRVFFDASTKFRYQIVYIDNNLLSSWNHLAKSLKGTNIEEEDRPGRYVRRLEMEVYDVYHTTRVDCIRSIISSCPNLKNLTLIFHNMDVLTQSDSRDILHTIRNTCGESLRVFRCRLGPNFHDTVLLDNIQYYPNIRIAASTCAYGQRNPDMVLRRNVKASSLEHLTVTSASDDTFERVSNWDLEALRYLSVHQAPTSAQLNVLFAVRGTQLTALELLSIKLQDVNDHNIFSNLPNLQDLVLGFPGMPRLRNFWILFNNSPIRRIGIRKFSPRFNRIHQIMYGLSMVMQHATQAARFPNLEIIQLLDFFPAQFLMAKWKYEYVNYWFEWRHDCDRQGIKFQDQQGAEIHPDVDSMTMLQPLDPEAELWTLSEEERRRRRRYLRMQQNIRYF